MILNIKNFNGDIISNGGVKNVTHNHYGNEQSTKVQEGGFEPYIQLLQQMVASYKDEGNWKSLLCPYKAAVTEGVLPKWTCKEFCKKMNVKIADSTYSQWMRDGSYTPEELDTYAEHFKDLKLKISPSQRQ